MSSSDLSAFNPFADHPFMSGGTSPQTSPLSTPAQEHERSLSVSPSPSGLASPSQSPAPASPLQAPAAPIRAPVPTLASRQVFEQYDRGRVTPDLVVRKKINNWNVQPSFR